jgi:hypothetical protein
MELTPDTWTITPKTEALISCPLEQTSVADMTQTFYTKRPRHHLLLSCYSDEQKEKVAMMALASGATVRVLGSLIANDINKVIYRLD